MESKMKLILMNKDDEVLLFSVDIQKRNVEILKKLAHFDKAPYALVKENADERYAFKRFIFLRGISMNRWDYDLIIKNTNVKSGFELTFKGHGLSLMDHFWFKKEGENLKYKDINFFENKWDDSFARCVLKGDYEGLKNCDLNVPDIVTGGWSAKGWIYDNGPKLYKLGIDKDSYDDCLGEVLASRLARRILKEDEVTLYELKKVGDKYASVSSLMINTNEELLAISNVLPHDLYQLYLTKTNDRNVNAKFFEKVSDYGIPELYEFFVKLSTLRSLCFVSDLHFDNISLIRDLTTKEIRVAPIYDLAGAFGSSRTGRDFISKLNKASYFIIYFLFGGLDPKWDYSWYDKDKLIGFEDDIKEVLSKSKFYTPEIIKKVIEVYHNQKASLDELSKK